MNIEHDNAQSQEHTMVLVTTHVSGAEEWYCPACGRRFLMQWPPNYQKIILEVGDEFAIHSGGKGGLSINTPMVTQIDGTGYTEEPGLATWEEWLENSNFESWWNREL